ncbi:endoglucanase [Lysinibacillus sp. 2017]|uniref:S-layer homology domain-containing protein n=1 Tax=unclassified Lysinibacillus TaxID=2636778 RepID=UPI000D5275FF|nr:MULTISPECIES: S-layer homology domain-containing protein [unclassified Lysinibacillus]AWE08881.1 endoglucanase [Lysinibacillus sp. 2017]TGN34734.1 endoglucanase [Lysinibacillus sp. S2017]
MKKFSVFATLLLVLQVVLPFSTNVQAETTEEQLNYLALGDSLAAGMNENHEIGYGYADFIALQYTDEVNQIQFNKGFSFPGYTTVNVLNDIQADVTKNIYDLDGPSQTTTTIHKAIKQADLISLSVGANDVLKYVNRSESGQFTFDLPAVLQTIQTVSANYEKIFAEIKKINPDADVIVMGLYNPYPYLQDAAIQTQLNTLVSTMNNAIKAVVEKNEGVFSEVADIIASNHLEYLPNPNNVHLGEAGYEVVAEKMMLDYVTAFLNDIDYDFEDIVPEEDIDFDYFPDISKHWAREYIIAAYDLGILKGYDDGTFKPSVSMSRVQVVSVLARAFDLKATTSAPFKDISQYDQQTQIEVAAAYEAGLIKENGGSFNPKGELTRAQLALMLLRLSNNLTGEEYTPTASMPFKDMAKYDDETKTAVNFLYESGIVEGTSATTFAPADKVTRAQLAKIIMLALSEQ